MRKSDFPNASDLLFYFPWLVSEVNLPVHFFSSYTEMWCWARLSCVFLFFTEGLKPDTKMLLTVASKKKSKAGKGDTTKEDESGKNDLAQPVTISLLFKRYVFDTQKKMIQSWESQRPPIAPERPNSEMNTGGLCVLSECVRPVPSSQTEPGSSCWLCAPSKIATIWFCSVKICLFCHLCNVNLYGLSENVTCQMSTFGGCVLIAVFFWIIVLKFLLI